MRILSATIAATLILSGCVSNPNKPVKYLPSTMEEVAQAVTTTRDDFKKQTAYRTNNIPTTAGDSVLLRAFKNDNGGSLYQIYVADWYDSEWRFYHSAYDSNGNRLDFVPISRDVGSCSRYGGCTHTEHFAITVTRDYLQSAAKTGITFKVSGKTGEEIFAIPAIYVEGFLASVAK